ncbi:App1 family protein [Winogradskyella jejuensis]|nr:phosphatase domain-containing protein [Winogradskyella jejuensis]
MLKRDPLQIIPFLTYGTSKHLYLRGRALEDEDIDLSKKGWFNLLVNSWKRFETDEIRNTAIQISVEGNEFHLKTDAEGYYLYDVSTELDFKTDAEGWLSYKVKYNDNSLKRHIQQDNLFKGQMLVPSQEAKFGVISDIDDTILHTGVTSRLKWKVVVNTFFKTPLKRKALEGTAEFYELLHDTVNPIFYVSNSPWNLYRYLEFFLKSNAFPKGPILLRDFRTPFDKTPKLELAHKYHEVFNILKTYPDLKFILIGDCGEKDAYIYLDVVEKFPNRIAAIYLRSVEHKKRMKRIKNLFKDYKELPVLIVDNSSEAIMHAKAHGFIEM